MDVSCPLGSVVGIVHGVVYPHNGSERNFGNAVRAAVRHRDTGCLAIAFEGRYSREQRRRGADEAPLARVREDDAAADPAPDSTDGEDPREADEDWSP